jgi:hypothetical protein
LEFFADRNLGTRVFPLILREAGVVVHLHQDYFPQDAPDVEWVPEVAGRGWPIISPDLKISQHRLEVAAVMTSGAAMFCLSGGHYMGEAQARNFLRCLPSILKILDTTERPFIAKVYQPNPDDPADTKTKRVEVKLRLAEWERRFRRGFD